MSIHRCCCGEEEGCWYLAQKCSCSPNLGDGQLAPAIPCLTLEKTEDPPDPLVFRHGTGEDLETPVCWFASSAGSPQVSVIPPGFEEVNPSTPFYENCSECCTPGCISCQQLPGLSCPGNITATISGYTLRPDYPPIGISPCRVPVDPFTVVMLNQNALSGPPRWAWNGNHQIFTEDGCPIDPAQANFTVICITSQFDPDDPGRWRLFAQLHPVAFLPNEPPQFQCETCIADTNATWTIPAGCACPVSGSWDFQTSLNLAPGASPSALVSV